MHLQKSSGAERSQQRIRCKAGAWLSLQREAVRWRKGARQPTQSSARAMARIVFEMYPSLSKPVIDREGLFVCVGMRDRPRRRSSVSWGASRARAVVSVLRRGLCRTAPGERGRIQGRYTAVNTSGSRGPSSLSLRTWKRRGPILGVKGTLSDASDHRVLLTATKTNPDGANGY